jgi:hypothetical protein
MSTEDSPVKKIANKLGVGGVAPQAGGAVGVARVTAVGAANGADDRPSPSAVTVAAPGDDDGTPDQGSGDAPGTPGATSTTVTTTAPATTAPPAATRSIPVPGVGEVVINEGTLGLVSATAAAGYTVRTEATAREIHVRFFDANGGRIDVQVEIEDGAPRIRIRDRRLEDGRGGNGSSGGRDDSPTVTTMPAAPTPTIDDHGGRSDRDDRVEVGDDRDDRGDDDSSGHGRGGDDDGDDDNSGHGSDDD